MTKSAGVSATCTLRTLTIGPDSQRSDTSSQVLFQVSCLPIIFATTSTKKTAQVGKKPGCFQSNKCFKVPSWCQKKGNVLTVSCNENAGHPLYTILQGCPMNTALHSCVPIAEKTPSQHTEDELHPLAPMVETAAHTMDNLPCNQSDMLEINRSRVQLFRRNNVRILQRKNKILKKRIAFETTLHSSLKKCLQRVGTGEFSLEGVFG